MTPIRIQGATLRYLGDSSAIFSGLEVRFEPATWTAILGPSGCGKSTLLRYIAGLLTDKVEFSAIEFSPPLDVLADQVAYMAQQDLLMPWLSVLDNVCLASRLNGKKVDARTLQKALSLLEKVGLADKAASNPNDLSGGQRQRVALARTLMQDKSVVLMDEPFSALDAVTRYKLQALAANLLKDKTVLLITHDPQEALRLGEQILVMNGKPARLHSITPPKQGIPRDIDGEFAAIQQSILEHLAGSHTEKLDVAERQGGSHDATR
ncbi:hydroxymethylpyrimidine ABC transporter ATPase component [Vibrio variabilis]|uniref:Hydroxymethylpyrimidine ABC transporter ATPase component n=1 Tax=Vibrio variabilis TaxID=990271 RepID=A0ABQ0J4U9_9VIBR|nr:hydroxymethylpyrimidine ABC transporter ATPase component [Vibrio variabilis]